MTKTLQDYVEELKKTENELMSIYQQIEEYIIIERNENGSLIFKYKPDINKNEIPTNVLRLIKKFSSLIGRYNYLLKRIKVKTASQNDNASTLVTNTVVTNPVNSIKDKTTAVVKQTTQKGMFSFLNIKNIKQSTIGTSNFSSYNKIRKVEIPNEMKMFFTIIAGLPILYFTFTYLIPLFYNLMMYILLFGNGLIDNVGKQISDGVGADNPFPIPIDMYTVILTVNKLYGYLSYFFLFLFGAWLLYWVYKVIRREYLIVAKIGEKIKKLK